MVAPPIAPGKAGRGRRALLTGSGAALLFATWAAYANWEHGASAIVVASLAQATLSFASTTSAVLLLEFLYGLVRGAGFRFALAGLGTPAAVLLVMAGVHVIVGTPDVLETIAPSVLSGTAFCIVYTAVLLARDRRKNAPSSSESVR